MRMQSSQANCGSTSLYNAACALGRTNLSMDECERACNVSATDGTTTKRLIVGAKQVGLKHIRDIKEARDEVALLLLDRGLALGAVAILAVDDDSHWVAVVGKGGGRYLVADSAESELVLSLSGEELVKRWESSRGRNKFYGAVIQ